jgi:hypothetical protein
MVPEAASVTGMLMNGATSGTMNNTNTSREVNLLEFNPLTQPHHATCLAGERGYLRVTPHHPKNPDPQTPRGPSRDPRKLGVAPRSYTFQHLNPWAPRFRACRLLNPPSI